MKPEPFAFQHPLGDFDLKRLPIDATLLRDDPAMLAAAVQAYYEDCFRRLGGSAAILVRDSVVSVTWYPSAGDAAQQVTEHAVDLLRQGDYASAEPLLRALLFRDPASLETLYNLGMMLSDQRRLDEAMVLLRRLVELEPQHANGWTALGVAYARASDTAQALPALKKAVAIDPANGFALRNLGGLLLQQSPAEAEPVLKTAADLLPQDQAAQYGYAQCLLQLDRMAEADAVLVRTIQLNSLSEIAELARTARTSIAHRNLRSAGVGGLRPDAVFYCLDGLQRFRAAGDAQTRAIVFEIAMLGRSGLDINDPAKKYSLRSVPGQFSGLHLVSLMYTGIQLLTPGADAGIDLSRELAEAKKLFT
jgi:tetratricopeptide (TPR) repeat protein